MGLLRKFPSVCCFRTTFCRFLFCVLTFGTFLTLCRAQIQSPPTMVKQMPSEGRMFQVPIGQDEIEKPFVLDCEATGHPEPKYKWFKNGRPYDFQAYDNRISQQPGRGTLVVTQPRPEDEGYYHCEATNEYGTSMSNAVFVRRSDLGSFPDEPPKETVMKEGEPLTLPCSPPTGFPKPQIFWIIQTFGGVLKSINNSRITVDPEGALHFSNVTVTDSYLDAHYACSASNYFIKKYILGNKIKMTVLQAGLSVVQNRVAPKKQYCSRPNVVVRRGEPLDIYCIFGGTPLPKIQWMKINAVVDSSRFIVRNYGKTFRLNNVDFEDAGIYNCTASNGVGYTQSCSTSVTVLSVPYWITAPNNTHAAEEESVRFECGAAGVPEPSVKWFINGVDLSLAASNPRRKLITSTVMTIENLKKSDTSVYQCNASNPLGYAFKDFYLNVLSLAPEITEPPEPWYETVYGASITLRCRVVGAPYPEVKWFRSGRKLTGGRYVVESSGDLRITQTSYTDTGRYQCIAQNKFGLMESDDALGHLRVRNKTTISMLEYHEVVAGLSVSFDCHAVSDINLTLDIEWQFNGQAMDFDNDQRKSAWSEGTLTIHETTESDSGAYTCIARTRLDNVTAETILIVQGVPNAPRLRSVECKEKSAIVTWEPAGDNRAPIVFYSIQYNTSYNPDVWETAYEHIPVTTNKFELSLKPYSNCSLSVFAHNKIGKSARSNPSSVCETTPDVPYSNPTAVKSMGTTSSNFVITWQKMSLEEHNGPRFFYRVFWKRADVEMDWQTRDVLDWKKNELVLEDQLINVPYNIKVEAHNEKGPANVAVVEVIGYAEEYIPLLGPLNLTLIRVIDSNTAEIAWDPVPPDSVRGHLKGYKIQAYNTREGQEHLREKVVTGNVSRAIVDILTPFSCNCVQVRVFNDAHDGPLSDAIRITTPEGKIGPVSSLKAVPMGSSRLWLYWSKPSEINGSINGYRIFYKKIEGTNNDDNAMTELQPPISNPNVNSAKLVALDSNTKYRITIKAATAAGLGAPYNINVSTRHSIKPPGKPRFSWNRLKLSDGRTALSITWIPNLTGNPGSYFYVQYRQKGTTEWQRTRDVVDDVKVVVTGLLHLTYEMRVVAVNGKDEVPSNIEEIQLRETDEQEPISWNVTESKDGNVDLRITWNSNTEHDNVGTFVVRYREKETDAWKETGNVPNDHSFTLKGLSKKKVYEISVFDSDDYSCECLN